MSDFSILRQENGDVPTDRDVVFSPPIRGIYPDVNALELTNGFVIWIKSPLKYSYHELQNLGYHSLTVSPNTTIKP